jgi:3-hydroxymyristoyl/3-hydroxydecanoyl-(acyl carrier protein) dehydratase
LVTAKLFPKSDEFTLGHPQRPGDVPTCLILEAMATSGVHLVYSHMDGRVLGVLLKLDEAVILSTVKAGEEILVHSELLGIQPEAQESVGLARIQGSAFVGEEPVAKCRLVLLCFPKNGFETSIPW